MDFEIYRESGEVEAWERMNVGFLELVRKQLLIWRLVETEYKQRLDMRGKALLAGEDVPDEFSDAGGPSDMEVTSDGLAAEDSRIKVINHQQNLGYGAALQSGFRAATKELVFYTDGDGQFDIEELPPLLPLMKNFDVVSCFRINSQDNLIRKILRVRLKVM